MNIYVSDDQHHFTIKFLIQTLGLHLYTYMINQIHQMTIPGIINWKLSDAE